MMTSNLLSVDIDLYCFILHDNFPSCLDISGSHYDISVFITHEFQDHIKVYFI